MITEAIAKIVKGENLDKEMAAAVMDEIMSGEATQAQIGSFLTALHIKGETIDEITAFAEIMRKHCGEFTPDVDEEIDIVGTGGDCAGTFNISTVSSLVTAAGGGKVAKHGNRAASSKCGTADCLEALGVNIAADCKVSEACLKDLGTCFLFARLCMDITRQDQDAFEESENAKPAIYYAVAYFYEHREEADHHALTLTLRSLLFGSRKEAF